MAELFKTRGIVVNYLKYGETSIITKILTEEFGMQSYIVNSVRTRKPRFSISLFQPLTLLELVVYKKKQASLNRISEIELLSHGSGIRDNVYKSCIALFVSEVLNHALKEELEDRALFDFVYEAVEMLERKQTHYNNFHLIFLIRLSGHLGFGPHSGGELLSQVYQRESADGSGEALVLDDLIAADFNAELNIKTLMRRAILEDLVRFYQIHIENFGRLRSMDVLRETLE